MKILRLMIAFSLFTGNQKVNLSLFDVCFRRNRDEAEANVRDLNQRVANINDKISSLTPKYKRLSEMMEAMIDARAESLRDLPQFDADDIAFWQECDG